MSKTKPAAAHPTSQSRHVFTQWKLRASQHLFSRDITAHAAKHETDLQEFGQSLNSDYYDKKKVFQRKSGAKAVFVFQSFVFQSFITSSEPSKRRFFLALHTHELDSLWTVLSGIIYVCCCQRLVRVQEIMSPLCTETHTVAVLTHSCLSEACT